MEIKVKLFANFRDKGPQNLAIGEAFSLNIKDDAKVIDVLKQLEIPEEDARIVLVNSVVTRDFQHSLKPADLLACFPPIGGG
ncbi:MAG: MoaD/ThiS family protein [Candidatus Hodarchaeales archaeon]|jgi:molybdopterin converting factor small subunit